MAWIGWGVGALLLFIVFVAAATADVETERSITPALTVAADERAVDSIAVLALATGDSTMPSQRLVALETILHDRRFSVSHDSAHVRYTRVMIDSADALTDQGLTVAARGLLSRIGTPPARADSVRAARLQARIVRVDEQQARESARQQAANARRAAAAAEAAEANERRRFAGEYERDLLGRGMDVNVSVQGTRATTLRLRYVLVSRPLAFQLAQGTVPTELRARGFKRLELRDGYGENYTLDLTTMQWR